jgi:3-methylcrotonyl-CoA carboxylase alpha subunit
MWLSDRGRVYESSDEPLPDHVDEFSTTVLDNEAVFVTTLGRTWRLGPVRIDGTGHHSAHDGDIFAPMPGKVIAVDVAEGEAVEAGQRLMVLEAMKMEHALTAPFDGTVTTLNASAGAQVQVEALLAVVEPAEE